MSIYWENESAPIRRHAIILTNAKLDSWRMYTSTGRNEFIDDNDNKYIYLDTAEKYRYVWNKWALSGVCLNFLLRKM